MEKREYEMMMFKNNAVVSGSRQRTSNKENIKLAYEYAISQGYTFSSRKVQ